MKFAQRGRHSHPDETGPSDHNLLSENYVHDNSYDCGITLASHVPATTVIPTAKLSFGVWYNTISRNVSQRNGTLSPGAGVGIFAPSPGTTNTGNVVIDNELLDNGATGVAMHNHAAPPSPAPPVNLNDNVIVGNHFSGNGPDNPGAPTSRTDRDQRLQHGSHHNNRDRAEYF